MRALQDARRTVRGRVLIGLLLVPGLPLATAFLVPAEALLVGVVAAGLWVGLLARSGGVTRTARRAIYLIAASAGVLWLAAFLMLDWR